MKRKITTFMVFFLVAFSVLPFNVFSAPSGVLYETKTVEQLTAGVTYEKNSRLYDRGWLDIHVLTVDIKNPNVKLDVLESTSEYALKETVETLAKQNGAIAAVNGDFFGSGNPGSSMGIVIRNGKVDSVQNYYNSGANEFAGFYIDNNMTPFIDFLRNPYIGFYNGPQAIIQLTGKNKVNGMKSPIYFDAASSTADLDKRYPNLWKIIVENNVISYISKAGETVSIPENGFAIVLDDKTATEHLGNYAVGQTAYFNETYQFIAHPDKNINTILLGLSGGGKILESGKYVVDQGMIIERNNRHPRTVIGITQDKSKIIIMAIDGRSHSIGTTHSETADILLEYGAYNAMHFDGGGSTTVATRPFGETQIKIVNTLSDGSQRRVANGLGIFTTSEQGQLSGFKLSLKDSQDNLAFEGIGVEVLSIAYDEHFNPIVGESFDIEYENLYISGEWIDNKFYPSEQGQGVLIAKVGDVKSEIPITVTSKPVLMRITPSSIRMSQNETKQLKIELINKDGYKVSLPPDDVDWTVENPIGVVENSVFKPTSNGKTYITASLGDLSAKTEIAVGSLSNTLTSFESTDSISFISYPEYVTGSTTYTSFEKYTGDSSLALSYSFLPNSTETQAAYADLRNANLKIGGNPQGISLWVKGDNTNSMLKARIIDATGKEHTLHFMDNLNFNEWKYAYSAIPKEAVLPVTLERLYVASTTTAQTQPSTIYLDFISVSYPYALEGNIGQTQFVDYMRQNLNTPPTEGYFDITVFGPTNGKNTPQDSIIQKDVINKMQQNASVAMFVGKTDLGEDKVNIPMVQWTDTYRHNGYSSVKIIELATSSGGMRATYANQWKEIENDLYATTQPNILLIANKEILSGSEPFTDPKEAELLHNVLKKFQQNTGKNVMVISGCGYTSGVIVKDAIRYVTLNGLWSKNASTYEDFKILRIRADNNSMVYDLQNVYTK